MGWIGLVCLYFAIAVGGHGILARVPGMGNIVFKFLVSGAIAGTMLGVHLVWLYQWSGITWAAALLYSFICELYIFLFMLVATSVSVLLLLTLGSGALTLDEIEQVCSTRRMVDKRFNDLLASGMLAPTETGYGITPKGERLLATFRTFRHFFRLGSRPQGFQ